ncbi:leucine-rich repeat-containing protein 27-like [Zootermopsis nevadensis]|nr:leucine-rich repeat-containing protein 27-like [Zootermopsis nevadensis]
MSDCENASSEEEDHHQTQNSETNSDFAEDQALIPGPGNASFFDISQKNLKQFPNYLYAKCLHVKHLYLEGNLLQDLSNNFFPSLPNLQWLDVRNNSLRNLPKSIANHNNLEVLLLQGNQIQALPLELGLVPKLRGIQLLGNPITFPPHEVLKQGIQSITAFLREGYNIQAPSPSTIRPIAEPFCKGVELRDGLLSQKFKTKSGLVKQRRKSSALHKKRVASSNLPAITVKSYQKLGLQPARPKTCVPLSQYKLSDAPPPEEVIFNNREYLPNLSSRIHSVSTKTLKSQLETERSRSEAKIQMNLLKEMFVTRIREMLEKQAAIIQRTKDKEMLRRWRQDGPQRNCKHESGELPYDTDPNYLKMPSRAELQNPKMARKWQNKQAQKKALKNIDEEMSDIFKSLLELDNSWKDTGLSPQTKKTILNNEMQMLEQLQKKLQVLHFRNARQNVAVLSLPVRGQHIHVGGRKNV